MRCSADTRTRRRAAPAWGLAALLLLRAAAPGQDGAIQTAIQRGRAALLPELVSQLDRTPSDYPMGRIALSLAALLKAGLPTDHAAVKRALEDLDGMPIAKTYSVACYLFALDAYWQGRYQESLRSGRGTGPTAVAEPLPHVPPDGPVRKKMEELIRWLVSGSGGTWHYQGRGAGDLSNTQFAILGLDIGLQNEIPIPLEVFRAILEHFVRSHAHTGSPQQFTVTYQTPEWEGVTAGTTRRMAYISPLGGWNYRSDPAGQPSNTMTAAGVSSLLVARRALKKAGQYLDNLAWEAERKIEAGLGWIGINWNSYRNTYEWTYYGLYSVEKVGDIGGISAFGSVDWYREGARFLLARQRRDGSWGNAVDTALALLFLTRATRSHLQTLGPPVLYTRVQEGDAEESGDVVYVDQVKGYVSAASIFEFLTEFRDAKVVPLAEEAVKAFGPHRAHEALARVLSLWDDDRDPVTRFAQDTAEELTGVRSRDRADFERLLGDLRLARELERRGNPDAGEVEALLKETSSPIVKRRAIDIIDRSGLLEAFGGLVEEVAHPDASVRRRARDVLVEWTGKDFPEAEGEPSPSRVAIEEALRPWREWWLERGDEFRQGRRAAILAERLRDEEHPDEAERTLRALVDLGLPAAAAIVGVMERGNFHVRLVQALEAITGESVGLRPADWKAVVERMRAGG